MQKLILATAFLTAAAATTVVAPASAQAASGLTVGLNAGIALPIGDASDVLKTGFGGGATITMRGPDARVGFGIDAQFYRFSFDDNTLGALADARSNNYGVMARLEFEASRPLYLLGGAGLFRQEITGDDDTPNFGSTSNTDFAIEGGAGFNFSRGIYAEGRIINIFTDNSSTRLIPITVGIRF